MGPYFKAGSKSQLHLIIQIIKVLRKSEGTERKKARLDRLGRSGKKGMWDIFKPASQTESRGWRVRPSSIQNRFFGLKMWVVFLTDVWRNTHGRVNFQSVFFTFMYFSVLSCVYHWCTVIGPLMTNICPEIDKYEETFLCGTKNQQHGWSSRRTGRSEVQQFAFEMTANWRPRTNILLQWQYCLDHEISRLIERNPSLYWRGDDADVCKYLHKLAYLDESPPKKNNLIES